MTAKAERKQERAIAVNKLIGSQLEHGYRFVDSGDAVTVMEYSPSEQHGYTEIDLRTWLHRIVTVNGSDSNERSLVDSIQSELTKNLRAEHN